LLLAGERPAADKRALVLSAHHTSLGQRFLLTPALRTYVMLDKFGTCDLVIDATADPWDEKEPKPTSAGSRPKGSMHMTASWG